MCRKFKRDVRCEVFILKVNLKGKWKMIKQYEEKLKMQNNRSGCMSFFSNFQLFYSNLGMLNLVPPGMVFFPGEYGRGEREGQRS